MPYNLRSILIAKQHDPKKPDRAPWWHKPILRHSLHLNMKELVGQLQICTQL